MMGEINLTAVYLANILGLLLTFVVLLCNLWRFREKTADNNYLVILQIVVIICCLVDSVDFTADGKPGFLNWVFVYGGNWLLFLADLILLPCWLAFVRNHLGVEISSLHRIISSVLTGFGMVILLMNYFMPVIYYVDEYNVYHRGLFFWYFNGLAIFFLLDSIYIYLRAKKDGGLLKFFPIWIFLIPFLFGLILQAVCYGISTIYACSAIAVSGVVICLQNELIFRDRLTGLYNRFYLDQLKESANKVKKNKKNKNKAKFTAMMLDLNNFKAINDQFGHSEGDAALLEVARHLQKMVATRGTVIRYAGDEFVILLNTLSNLEAQRMIKKIRDGFEERNENTDKPYKLTASIGYEIIDLSQMTVGELITMVDRRMFEDKRAFYVGNRANDRRKVRDYMDDASQRSKEKVKHVFSIFHSVAEDYICLIDVDMYTGTEVQYLMDSAADIQLPKWSDANAYSTSIVDYANMFIVPEDRDWFIEMTKIDRMKTILQVQKEFVIEYTTEIAGVQRHFQGRFTLNRENADKGLNVGGAGRDSASLALGGKGAGAEGAGNGLNLKGKEDWNGVHMFIGIRDISETKLYEARSKEITQYDHYRKLLDTNMSDRRTVLVIEDNAFNRELLKDILEQEYNVLTAENGQVGMDVLNSTYRSISLILLNLQMPVMDGYEFLKIVKEDLLYSMIPTIVLTSDENAEERCLDLGAADFISMPLRSKLILSRVGSIIKLRESAATLAAVEFDSLTGLYTKQAFVHHTENILMQNVDDNYCMIAMDIEDFKSVNEHYGSRIGDSVLKAAADYIRLFEKRCVLLGRLGGDRFVGLLKTAGPEFDKEEFIQIATAVQDYMPIEKLVVKFAAYDHVEHAQAGSVLVDRTMSALQQVKHKYGTIIGYYDEELQEQQKRNRTIELSMQEACDKELFKTYFQPKHDTKTGKLIGAEALIRWIHPEYGFLSPKEFIPLFEKNGFITQTDLYIWKHCCRYLREWTDKGLQIVPVSVNFSKLDFAYGELFDQLNKATADYHLGAEYLHMEVTESVFSENIKHIVAVLNRCRDRGYQIELDDFGSGYSSMNALADLPIDIVKFDMSFMREIYKPQKKKVLQGCVNLAKSLNLKTIIEGVEWENQRVLVEEYGIDAVQGYYYSKPLPADEFEEYLRKQNS